MFSPCCHPFQRFRNQLSRLNKHSNKKKSLASKQNSGMQTASSAVPRRTASEEKEEAQYRNRATKKALKTISLEMSRLAHEHRAARNHWKACTKKWQENICQTKQQVGARVLETRRYPNANASFSAAYWPWAHVFSRIEMKTDGSTLYTLSYPFVGEFFSATESKGFLWGERFLNQWQ